MSSSHLEQLTLLNPIDQQPGTYAQAAAPSPRIDDGVGRGTGRYKATPPEKAQAIAIAPPAQAAALAQAQALAIGDTVEILPFTDPWGFSRGKFEQAVVTAISQREHGVNAGERVTVKIPGVSERSGYVVSLERVRKL